MDMDEDETNITLKIPKNVFGQNEFVQRWNHNVNVRPIGTFFVSFSLFLFSQLQQRNF